MDFNIEQFVNQCQSVCRSTADPSVLLKDILTKVLSHSQAEAEILPASGEEEILLYHSSDLTIYRVLQMASKK